MLELKDVVKEYKTADETVAALKGVSLKFRKSEFVSILGPSGCGKTTLLNIIGGLDRYTSGDLIINGKSTKDFSDKDWDTYRITRSVSSFRVIILYRIRPFSKTSNSRLRFRVSGRKNAAKGR